MANERKRQPEDGELTGADEAEVSSRSSLSRWARSERRREEAAMTPLERVKLALRLGLMALEFERRAKR
jgi:hypothetical protein